MSMGVPWDEATPASASKKNYTSVISDTGANLILLDKEKFKIVTCTDTGGGFELDHAYLFLTDGTGYIDLTDIGSHTHSSDIDGGGVETLFAENPSFCNLWLTKTDDLLKAQWIETVTSTGSIENKTDGTTGERSIRLRTNGTSGATATISYPHLQLDFSKPSIFGAKLQIETATSVALHTGVQCDDTSAADSNTRKYQAEVCTATNNNWWLRTATGSAQTGSDSGIAISANRVGVAMKHYPTLGTPEVDLYIDTNTAFQKTTNIPTSGATADNNLIKHSVKNSTAADRPLLVYGSRLSYYISDEWVV